MAFVRSSQRFVSGEVRLKLSHGVCSVVGRRSPQSLYQHALATYERGDAFNHASALGFIELWGLPVKTQAQVQLLSGQQGDAPALPGIAGQIAQPVEARAEDTGEPSLAGTAS